MIKTAKILRAIYYEIKFFWGIVGELKPARSFVLKSDIPEEFRGTSRLLLRHLPDDKRGNLLLSALVECERYVKLNEHTVLRETLGPITLPAAAETAVLVWLPRIKLAAAMSVIESRR